MSSQKNTTLVMGASENPERYSYKAILKLQSGKWPVAALGKKSGKVNGVGILTGQPLLENIDTVTLYLNPEHQKQYYNYILSLKPRRVIFNPGAENPELEALALAHNVEAQNACTLVLLATKQY
jgi:uncharacterized protein